MEKGGLEMTPNINTINLLDITNIDVVVLANGEYPCNEIPLSLIHRGIPIVCCDGAIAKLDLKNITPIAVIGDGDSIPQHLKDKYQNCWHYIAEQETNDLTKAVNYCIEHRFKHIAILGATGMREDHTLGNISLLAKYCKNADVRMYTDYGVFTAIFTSTNIVSFPKQQISIFNLLQTNQLNAEGLLYPIKDRNFCQWWEGTLNEAVANSFTLYLDGETIVFQTYEGKK
jgi:thiamine pyrophosphokinase